MMRHTHRRRSSGAAGPISKAAFEATGTGGITATSDRFGNHWPAEISCCSHQMTEIFPGDIALGICCETETRHTVQFSALVNDGCVQLFDGNCSRSAHFSTARLKRLMRHISLLCGTAD
jgi:hypothetical protein